MSSQFDIGIFGGDLRQVYIASALLSKGYSVITYGTSETVNHKKCKQAESLSELFEKCRVLVGPIPLSRDRESVTSVITPADLTLASVIHLLRKEHLLFSGVIPSSIKELCSSKDIFYFDFMDSERITILNAIATAEGTIMEAITGSNVNLHDSHCLVLGYGRCAKVLAQKLKALDALVTVAARSEEALAYAEASGLKTISIFNMKALLPSMQFIFNTIPALVLDKSCLELVDKQVTIIDIASAPGGVDFEYAKQQKLNAKLCLGLPGKVAPKTSADILVTEIIALIKERSD